MNTDTSQDLTAITLLRLPDGRWTSRGPHGAERQYVGEAARVLDLMFNKQAEGSKR